MAGKKYQRKYVSVKFDKKNPYLPGIFKIFKFREDYLDKNIKLYIKDNNIMDKIKKEKIIKNIWKHIVLNPFVYYTINKKEGEEVIDVTFMFLSDNKKSLVIHNKTEALKKFEIREKGTPYFLFEIINWEPLYICNYIFSMRFSTEKELEKYVISLKPYKKTKNELFIFYLEWCTYMVNEKTFQRYLKRVKLKKIKFEKGKKENNINIGIDCFWALR